MDAPDLSGAIVSPAPADPEPLTPHEQRLVALDDATVELARMYGGDEDWARGEILRMSAGLQAGAACGGIPAEAAPMFAFQPPRRPRSSRPRTGRPSAGPRGPR